MTMNADKACRANFQQVLSPVTLRIDADITNGARPCDPIDDTATVSVGSKDKVGVCIKDYMPNSIEAFELHIRYSGDPNATPPTTVNNAQTLTGPAPMLDLNPDANDGSGSDKLGTGWDCSGSPPLGDDPWTPGVADALILCYADLVTQPGPLGQPWPAGHHRVHGHQGWDYTIDFGPIDGSNWNSVGSPRATGDGWATCSTLVAEEQVGCFGATIRKVDSLDTDGDTVPDSVDNCPFVYNPGQGIPMATAWVTRATTAR